MIKSEKFKQIHLNAIQCCYWNSQLSQRFNYFLFPFKSFMPQMLTLGYEHLYYLAKTYAILIFDLETDSMAQVNKLVH